jgi:hypothetical protein
LAYSAIAFSLIATDSAGQNVHSFSEPFTITLHYTGGVLEAQRVTDPRQLGIYFYDVQAHGWTRLPTVAVNTIAQTVTAEVAHLTEFALFGDLFPPVTHATLDGTQLPDGTFTTPVSVLVGAADVDSPVASTNVQVVNRGTPFSSTGWLPLPSPFVVSAPGKGDVYAYSTEVAANAEAPSVIDALRFAPPQPVVTITGLPSGSIQIGTQVTLNASISGGTAPFAYAWAKNGQPVQGGSTLSDAPAQTSTYSVLVSDAFGLQAMAPAVTVLVVSDPRDGGGTGCGSCPPAPPPASTPELDSLLLFATGLLGIGSQGIRHLKGRRRG